ncbi:MAG: ROK family protein, partial [Planctomycetes bacterium]|nr:ROK family protein [Planctomycetota bacterium]
TRLAEALSARVDADARLCTDAEAATWGEYSAPAFRARRFVHLRLGTGIGCGVVLDGRLQRLDLDRTTHLEALVVDHGEDAALCGCGLRGCLELVASGEVLLQQDASGIAERVTPAIITALENLTRQFDPEVIVIGGGVLSRFGALQDSIMRSADLSLNLAPIECARLGDDAGVIGAARVART